MANTTKGNEHQAEIREQSLGGLVGEITRDLGELLRKEVQLAKVEIKQEARQAAKGGSMLAGAGATAYLALLLASFAAAWGLAEVIATGLAFLVVAILHAAVAAALYAKGRKTVKDVDPVPKQTVETMKEDVEWARKQMS